MPENAVDVIALDVIALDVIAVDVIAVDVELRDYGLAHRGGASHKAAMKAAEQFQLGESPVRRPIGGVPGVSEESTRATGATGDNRNPGGVQAAGRPSPRTLGDGL
ncbi:hypothetical protein ABZV14_37095 [Streptosporangium canum]|uniref:hypothetical protein n=1 Tax=Streptosporangium canum TaxID=324952 RepID=UPI0033BF7C0F